MRGSQCASCRHNLGFQPSKDGSPQEVFCDLNSAAMTLVPLGQCPNHTLPEVRSPVFAGLPPLKTSNFMEHAIAA